MRLTLLIVKSHIHIARSCKPKAWSIITIQYVRTTGHHSLRALASA